MKTETQKLIIRRMLSSNEIFSRCISILSPEYFDPELKPIVKFMVSHFEKYSVCPKIDFINAEFDCDFTPVVIDSTDIKFTCDQIELFCKQGALYKAIIDSAADVTSGDSQNFPKVLDRVRAALSVSLQKDIGIEVYTNVEKRLLSYLDTDIYEPTGIEGIDKPLGGGLSRRQVTLFSANSGGGKSIMLSNLGANYSRRGFRVLQLALELTEQMIDLRNLSILTGVKTDEWKSNMSQIIGKLNNHVGAGAGSFIIKRIPGGSTATDIRSYLKLYESEYGCAPDVLIVDYLDLMKPNGGTKNKDISQQDKEKSEQLAEIAYDYNCITLTASQQNREAIKTSSPDQSVIAGGLTKVNTVDNYISIYMNPEMRLKGEMFIYFLKTRSSSAVGSMSQLTFNPDNLIISDKKIKTVSVIRAIKNRNKNMDSRMVLPGVREEELQSIKNIETEDLIDHNIVDYNDVSHKYNKNGKNIDIEDDSQLWNTPRRKINGSTDHENLLSLMSFLNN